MKILKYTLAVTPVQKVDMPLGARILSAQEQQGQIRIWAFCDPSLPNKSRILRLIGTGNEIDLPLRGLKFISTVQEGIYVWHVFQEGRDDD